MALLFKKRQHKKMLSAHFFNSILLTTTLWLCHQLQSHHLVVPLKQCHAGQRVVSYSCAGLFFCTPDVELALKTAFDFDLGSLNRVQWTLQKNPKPLFKMTRYSQQHLQLMCTFWGNLRNMSCVSKNTTDISTVLQTMMLLAQQVMDVVFFLHTRFFFYNFFDCPCCVVQ